MKIILVVLLGFFEIDGREIDAAIIKRDGLIIIDLKAYGGTLLKADQKGDWFCLDHDGNEVLIQGGSPPKNPFQQVSNNCERFINYFYKLKNPFPGENFPTLRLAQSMIYFSDKMEKAQEIWKQNFGNKRTRFFISTINSILGDVKDISNPKIFNPG